MQRRSPPSVLRAGITRARLRRLRRLPALSPRQWLRQIVFWTGAIIVAGVAIGFAQAATWAQDGFARLVAWHAVLAWAMPPLGVAGALLLTRRVFPGAQGSGIPQVIASLHMSDPAHVDAVLSLRIAIGKILLTLLGLFCGASIGREGPTVQISAAVMNAIGRFMRIPALDAQRALVLAGGAAGIAAAFNTPLAGIVFAIEELSHSFEARTSGTVLTAVIVAGIATLALAGNYTYFGVTSAQLEIGEGWFIAVLLCGVCGGIAGGAFSAALVRAARGVPGLAGRLVIRFPLGFALLCGLIIAAVGVVSGGETYGTGYAQARGLVEGTSHVSTWFFLLKLVANVVSYVSGIPGGIFSPSLAVGAGLGSFLSGLIPQAPASAIVLLGMVGYFSGVVQAPITAIIIVMEMTDNQRMTIPLMATAVIAFGASRLICRQPVYSALARRFLMAVEPSQSVAGREER